MSSDPPEKHEATATARVIENAPARFVRPPVAPASRVLKSIYWLLWFFVVPLGAAIFLIGLLNQGAMAERGGLLGGLEALAHGQPIPSGIVIFTLFEMGLWQARHHLPLARHAHPPLRPDLPEKLRAPYERARMLLDEADGILVRHTRTVTRDLTPKEREKLKVDLDALRVEMAKEPFDEEAFADALVRADGEVDVRLKSWRKGEVREYLESIGLAVMAAMALRAFFIEAFKIPSGSMIPTLQVGDHIFVNKLSYGPNIPFTKARFWSRMPPERGDVMVFAFPEKPEQDFIKRVVALPGDRLDARDGHPIINGWEVPSCRVGVYSYDDADGDVLDAHHEGDLFVEYLGDEAYLTLYDRQLRAGSRSHGPFFVKQGEVYVMGDNRNNSHDSRMWWGGAGGGVPFENIRGRALFVWLSVGDAGMDWSRLGVSVMGQPKLPKAMKELEAPMANCLRERPPLSKTTPPAPGGAPREATPTREPSPASPGSGVSPASPGSGVSPAYPGALEASDGGLRGVWE